MAFKLAIVAAILAYANAGLIGAPAVAAYSAAPAVSSSYIHQASAPVAYAQTYAAPVAHAAYTQTYAAPIAHGPVAISAPAIGASHQSVLRSLGGNQAVSHYSKAVDSAFSSVRKYDTRITNDALSLGVAHAPVATYAHAAPVAAYAHAAPVAAYAHAAPVAAYAHAAPVATYAHSAPVLAAHGPVAYSPAAVVSHVSFSGLGAQYAW